MDGTFLEKVEQAKQLAQAALQEHLIKVVSQPMEVTAPEEQQQVDRGDMLVGELPTESVDEAQGAKGNVPQPSAESAFVEHGANLNSHTLILGM